MALSIAQPRAAPALAVGAGLAALAIAYASQVWGGLPPCVLCIYQRYAHAVAVLFGLAALAMARRPERRRLFLALAGLSLAASHRVAGRGSGPVSAKRPML